MRILIEKEPRVLRRATRRTSLSTLDQPTKFQGPGAPQRASYKKNLLQQAGGAVLVLGDQNAGAQDRATCRFGRLA